MVSIYVIGGATGPKKIGIARNPKARLSQIVSSSAAPVRILHSREMDDAAGVEAHAHHLLSARWVRGEWFKVSLEDAISAIDQAAALVAAGDTRPKRLSVGRPKIFAEQLRVPLVAGSIARIDAVLAAGEPRLDMIREAIEREIKRRSKASKA